MGDFPDTLNRRRSRRKSCEPHRQRHDQWCPSLVQGSLCQQGKRNRRRDLHRRGRGSHHHAVGDAATADACITIYQATPAVTGETTKAAVAGGRPPDDEGAGTLDTSTRGSPGARNTTTISDQTGAINATKAPTGDARGGAGGGRLGTRIEPRAATAATKDSVADTCRERAAPRGSPGWLLRVLRGLGGPYGPYRKLPSPTPPAVVCRPPRRGSDTPTLPGVSSDRNSRRN